MKRLYTFLFLIFITITAFSQSRADNDKVWQKALDLNKAIFETKDSAAIQNLVAATVTYGHSGGNLEDKTTMLHNAVANTEVYKNISIEKLHVGNAGNSVIVRYILRADAIKNGNTNQLNISILQVWAKDKGNWQLYARQAVKVAPK